MEETSPTSTEDHEQFPIESTHENKKKLTLLDNTRKVPASVLEENKNILTGKAYRVDDDKFHRRSCPWVDLSKEIEVMQDSVQLFGGHSVDDYKALIHDFEFGDIPRFNESLFGTVEEDCVDFTIKLKNATGRTPLLLNLAQRWIEHICGAWWNTWAGSQEETIERRSAVYRLGLDPDMNPKFKNLLIQNNDGTLPDFHIPQFGAVLHKGVPIIRDRKWRFYDKPVLLDVLAVGGIDLRWLQVFRHGERAAYVANPLAPAPLTTIKEDKFRKHLKYKLRTILVSALMEQYYDLVLGAIGCGAFENPVYTVVECWKEVLEEDRFKGAFRNVVFSVIGASYKPFAQTFTPITVDQLLKGMPA